MNDFLKKLNVLIRSNLNDALDSTSPRPRASSLGRGIENEIAALRVRIDDALAYEETLRRRLLELDDEIARWDAQADRALEAGDDAGGRYALQQMRRTEGRQAGLSRDLRQHQQSAAEFIEQVNRLEAYAAQQKGSLTNAPPLARGSDARGARDLADTLREAREAAPRTSLEMPTSSAQGDDEPADEALDRDLERRRQRLSKPPGAS